MGISTAITGVGGWTVGPVVGRRPAGAARDAVHPGTGARAVLVIVDSRFTARGLPDPETVARAAIVGSPAVMPMLDAGLLEDGTRWYVTPAAPGPVLDPAAGCSPRRAAAIAEGVARGLAAVHAAGLVHGLVGAQTVVPAGGRHTDRPVGTTLLLDTGVAALLGDGADELAAAGGVSLPADRGAEADVHALGALLLRLLTAAAPAGPALAALPVELRALLSAMLDDDPAGRPTAGAVARTLGELRQGLPATGPVPIQSPSAPDRRPGTAPLPRSAAASSAAPAAVIRPTVAAPLVAAPPAVPAPIPAPQTLASLILATGPVAAPSLWTGPVPVAAPARASRRRGRRILMLAGGVGLAGLLVGVVTHLPLGHVAGDQAVAAVADHGLVAAPSGSATGASSAVTAATKPKPSHAAAVPLASARPIAITAVPHAASASSTTPSRSTATRSTGSRASSAPTSSHRPTASTSPTRTSSPRPATSSTSPVTSTAPAATATATGTTSTGTSSTGTTSTGTTPTPTPTPTL
ncbi:MAG: hypothetical protein HIU86_01675 [Acidobacteria bacterium]|nr:hypothetical protein [Acidobacteriota bacterium]